MNQPRSGRDFDRDRPGSSGTSHPRVSVLTRGWGVALLALASGLAYISEAPTALTARRTRFVNHDGPMHALVYRADGRLVMATRGNVWRVAAGHSDDAGPGLLGSCLALSPDGEQMAVGEEAKVTIRDVPSARIRVEFPTRTGTTLALAFSPDGGTIAVGGEDGVSVRDVGSGHDLADLPPGPRYVTSLAFTADGHTLAIGDRQGDVRIWDLLEHRWLGGLRAHSYAVTSLGFSRDGHVLLSASPMDTTARFWDVVTLRPLASLRGHTAPVMAAAFAHSGRTLITADREGVVRLWDAATGRLLAVLVGNDNGACALAFSKDDRTLVAAGVSGSVWAWDVAGASA